MTFLGGLYAPPKKSMGLEGRVHGVLCVLLWFGPRYVQLRFCDFSSQLICTPEAKAWVGEKQAACLRAPQFKKKHIAKRKSYDTENAQKRRCLGGNRILWTSGQVTEVHKILVTT